MLGISLFFPAFPVPLTFELLLGLSLLFLRCFFLLFGWGFFGH